MKQVFDAEGNAHKCEPVDAREMIASGSYYASYDLVPSVRAAKEKAAQEFAEAQKTDAPKLTKKQQAAQDALDLAAAQDLAKG
jgi:hypothetical protein